MKPVLKIFCLLLLMSCFGFTNSHAGWIENGVPLTSQWGAVETAVIVSDGSSGAIIAYQACYEGVGRIIAQHVASLGNVLWGIEGIRVCTSAGHQEEPCIVSDGFGGAIIAWVDNRSGNYHIYAQRVNASGTVLWTANGVALCTATGGQYYPTITSDGAGGAIVTWQDYRSGTDLDIYAQRVNASGETLWTLDGVPFCTATGDQQFPQIASDGAGGAIVTWYDYRSGIDDDIYAQRVNASGAIQWTPNGVSLCVATGNQHYPQITSDSGSVVIVAWMDYRSGSPGIYAQRLNASGAAHWMSNGVPLCPGGAGDQNYPGIVSDGKGGAIVTWQDSNGGSPGVHAQRLNARGDILWTGDGVSLCTAMGNEESRDIIPDGAGGAIVVWDDSRGGNARVYAQRVDSSGAVLWSTGGVLLCTALGNQGWPRITSDGAGGAIVVWDDSRGGNARVYAQRVNGSGAIPNPWPTDGVLLCTSTGDQGESQIVSDGAGGAIVTWNDGRNGSPGVYVQRVNASGETLWTLDGVLLCTPTTEEASPKIASDGNGGAIVIWEDYRSVGRCDLYAQRVNASGTPLWTANGVLLCAEPAWRWDPEITSDGAGGAIVVWYDYRLGGGIYAQRVNASGGTLWTSNGAALCTVTGDTGYRHIISDGNGGAIVTWVDDRGGNYDIYAQRVNASGAIPDSSWVPDGVPLCTATGDQSSPQITFDGAGGAIVAWTDGRCVSWIYAQRIRASGEIVATLLQNYSTALEGTSIRLAWALSEIDEGARFSIYRASAPDWKYMELDGAAIVQDRLSFTFTDTCCLPGSTYKYRVECEVEGTARRILFETDAITMPPLPVTLYQNHPNPFNPKTMIRFYLPEAQEIFLDVYDVAGERVARIAEGKREKGHHEVIWDGRNSSGEICSSGVYFSRLKAGKSTISRKMVIMR